MLTPKTLLPITLVLVLVAGAAFGYGLADMTRSHQPATEREAELSDAVTNERLSITSSADSLRTKGIRATEAFALSLAADTQVVVRGTDDAQLADIVSSNLSTMTNVPVDYLGTEAVTVVRNGWKDFINAVLAYASAVQTNNASDMAAAATQLTNTSHALANAYVTVVPTLSPAATGLAWQQVATAAPTLIRAQHGGAAGTILNAQNNLLEVLVSWSDILTTGVIQAYPSRF